jgi:hypothetical protein
MTPDERDNQGKFTLDRDRLAEHLIETYGEPWGFDSSDERGFAAAIASRFHDALDAKAIIGPSELQPIVYAIASDSLIVALREGELPNHLAFPLRQVATYSFETSAVACPGDQSFEECCCGLLELLDQANALLPSFAALRRGEDGVRHGIDGV